jgi:hypothetical protein
MRAWLGAALLGFAGGLGVTAVAAAPLPPDGEPIATSEYTLDMFQGPILASGRTTALAGSTVAIAEGVDGLATSPAAASVRPLWSQPWFDYDLTLSFTSPNGLRRSDFDNNGSEGFRYADFVFATAGFNLNFGKWGFGVAYDFQTYHLAELRQADGSTATLNAQIDRGRFALARSLFLGEVMWGVGLRLASLQFLPDPNADQNVAISRYGSSGASLETGVVWVPMGRPFRCAITARLPTRGTAVSNRGDASAGNVTDAEGNLRVGSLYVPRRIESPWDVEAGLAWQVGPRPLNSRWVDPRSELRALRRTLQGSSLSKQEQRARIRERRRELRRKFQENYRETPREKVLLTTSLSVAGPVSNAVGVESLLSQTVERSGRRAVLVPRVGVEVEPVVDRLQARAGSYLEPSRFDSGRPRLHGTAGADLRFLDWSVFGLAGKDARWRVGGYLDVAPRYVAWGTTLGLWH